MYSDYGSAAPLGLNKCMSMINPGLAPWAMQEYRPKGLNISCETILFFSQNTETCTRH